MVVEAGSSDEASSVLETHPDVQVVFADVDLRQAQMAWSLPTSFTGLAQCW